MLRQDCVNPCLPAFIQRRIDTAKLFGQLGGFGFVCGQIGLPQRHAAADVVTDERGIKTAEAKKCRADGIAAPGMQIGHTGHPAHLWQAGGVLELLDGVAFNPGI
ncbi:hypothetical protein A7P94_00770 [Eikenella sp. NML01-A-086]|nr:hypothetical protein A7P94_00770 [Eikenella sp. NML01-A-086]